MAEERVLNAERNCMNCLKNETCWARIEQQKIIDHWPLAGFVNAGAPGYIGDIFMSLANACLEFEFDKLRKK